MAGVGILLQPKFENIMDKVEYLNENTMHVTIKTDTGRSTLQEHTCPGYEEGREIFFEEFQDTVE